MSRPLQNLLARYERACEWHDGAGDGGPGRLMRAAELRAVAAEIRAAVDIGLALGCQPGDQEIQVWTDRAMAADRRARRLETGRAS